MDGKVKQDGRPCLLNITGILGFGTTATPRLTYAVNVSFRDILLAHLPPTGAFTFNDGRVDVHMALKGTSENAAQARGSVLGRELDFAFQSDAREKFYHLPEVGLAFEAQLEQGVLQLSTWGPKGPGFALTTQTTLDVTEPDNPYLDLHIQSAPLSLAMFKTLFPDPLLPQWLGTTLFPLFSNGSVQLDGLRLKGSLAKIGNLDQRENADALAVYLRIQDVDAFAEESLRPVSDVSGKVAVEDGQLLVSEVRGRFGSSRLDEFTLTFGDLYQSGQHYDFSVKGDFDLDDLKIQAPLKIIPRPIGRFVDRFDVAEGRLICDSRWFFSPAPPYLERVTGHFELGQSRLMYATMRAPLQIERARFTAPLREQAHLLLAARWQDSQFQADSMIDLEGYLRKPDRFPSHSLSVNGDFEIGNVVAFFQKRFPLTPLGDHTSRISAAYGGMQARLRTNYDAGKAAVAIEKLSLRLSQCRLLHRKSPFPISVAAAEFDYDPQGRTYLQGNGAWGQSQVAISGKSNQNLESLQILIAGRVSLAEINRQFFPQITLPLSATSLTGIRLMVERASSTWQCRGQVFLKNHQLSLGQQTLLFDTPQDMISFEIDINGREAIHINKAHVHVGQSTLSAQGHYAIRDGKRLELKLAANQLQLQDINLHALEQEQPISGKMTGHLSFSTALIAPFSPEFNGEIHIRQLSAEIPHLPAPIRDGTAHLIFSKEKIHLDMIRFFIGDDPINISGRLEGRQKWEGQLLIRADQLDITHWNFTQSLEKIGNRPKSALSIQIPIKINIAELRYRSLLYGPLTAQCTYRQDGVSIDNAQLSLHPGLLKISGHVQNHPRVDTLLSIYINTANQPAGHLLTLVERKQKDIQLQGALSIRGIGYLKSDGQHPLFRTLSGIFSFELKDGAVKNDMALLRILDLLSLQNIFIKRPPDLREESFFFESLQGTIEAKNGILKIDNMIMRSPVINSATTGSIDLKEGTVELNLGAQPLGTIDYLVSKIPIAGHILTGNDKALLVYYFNIGGTLEEPTVTYTPFKKLDESIVGYFKRTFFTPERIYKKIKNFADDLLQYDHPPTAEEIERFERLQTHDIHK
jgi:hypothetical protein